MAKTIKNWVLVSEQVPPEFDVLDFHNDDATESTCPIVPNWDHRVYEVPEFGSFEDVEVTKNDRFIAQVCGSSLKEIDVWPHEPGMIGDIRSWAGEYRIFAINGDFVTIPVHDRYFRAFESQRFGLDPYRSWDPDVELGEDLTEHVFD